MTRRPRAVFSALAAVLLVSALTPVARAAAPAPKAARPDVAPLSERRALDAYAATSMRFEENVGQTDARVRYLARGDGYTAFLTSSDVTLALAPEGRRGEAIRLSWPGASRTPRLVPVNPLATQTSYLTGSERSTWKRDVPTYAGVRYEGVYEGVDVAVYGNQRRLEYDVRVAPGADASVARVRFEGAREVRIDDATGDVVLRMASGEVRQQRAVAYETDGAGNRRAVAVRHVLRGDGEIGFAVSGRDPRRPLVIDPLLAYGAFLGGGRSRDEALAIALDASGAAYVGGTTYSTDFPVTAGALDATIVGASGETEGFVAKLTPSGNALAFATYLGGSSLDAVSAVALDGSGAVTVAGTTRSADFPTTPGAYDTTFDTIDPENIREEYFVSKLNATGTSLVYSTFFDAGQYSVDGYRPSLAADASGAAYLAGTTSSSALPTTPGAFQTTTSNNGNSMFVAKLAPGGGSLAYCTYVGGPFDDTLGGVALGPGGALVLAGSSDGEFPTTSGAYDTASAGRDAVVARLSASGGALDFSTYLGGQNVDEARAVAVAATGAVYVTGTTLSADFPTTAGAVHTTGAGTYDVFVTKLAASGATLAYSAVMGGAGDDTGQAIAVDANGRAYVAGTTASVDFPTTAGAFDTTFTSGRYPLLPPYGDLCGFALRLSATGGSLDYATYLGATTTSANAITVDASGAAYVAGSSLDLTFPQTGSIPRAVDDGASAFVTKLAPSGATLVYSAVVGGSVGYDDHAEYEQGEAIAVDTSGNAYVVGTVNGPLFPVTPGAYDTTYAFEYFVFVAKIDWSGTALVYATYLGGDTNLVYNFGNDVAVDANGSAYVVGNTASGNFPTTTGAAQTVRRGTGDAFVTKLTPAGDDLVYSTLLGGTDPYDEEARAVAIDASGNAYVVGSTNANDFPTTAGALQPATPCTSPDFARGFVTKLNPTGTALVYSTYFYCLDFGRIDAVAADASGAAYLTGEGFVPATPGAVDASGSFFVTKLAPAGNAVVYTAKLGGGGGNAIEVDGTGAAYVAGTSNGSFAVTPGAFDTTDEGNVPVAAVAKLAPTGASLAFGTLLGGGVATYGNGVAFDAAGRVYVAGSTQSHDFPLTPDAIDATIESGFATEGFVSVLGSNGSSLLFSTYLGGSGGDVVNDLALGRNGDVYVTGTTSSTDFLRTGFGRLDMANAFVARLKTLARDTVGVYVAGTGTWFLRNANAPGGADLAFGYGGAGGLVPLRGDWDGDGVDTPGLYSPSTGAFFLENTSGPGGADVVFQFGAGGAGIVPLSGDWDGDGTDTVGLYNTTTGAFFLRNADTPGGADLVFQFGAGGLVPLSGDWDSDGADSIGLYDPSTGAFFLRNTNSGGGANVVFTFGAGGAGLVPLSGDWDGDGNDTVGLYNPSTGGWFLRNENAPGPADLAFGYGPPGLTPLAGDWDGAGSAFQRPDLGVERRE